MQCKYVVHNLCLLLHEVEIRQMLITLYEHVICDMLLENVGSIDALDG